MQNNELTNTKNTTKSRKNSDVATVNDKKANVVKRTSKKVVSAKRASNMHAVRAPRIVNVKKEDKAPFPWGVIIVAALFTSLFLFMMMNYAEVDKYRSEITELDKQITRLEKTQDELNVALDDKYDLKEVADYASNELGMTSEKKYNYITIEQGDKTEMYNYDDGEEEGFGFLLTGFGEIIRDFLK